MGALEGAWHVKLLCSIIKWHFPSNGSLFCLHDVLCCADPVQQTPRMLVLKRGC